MVVERRIFVFASSLVVLFVSAVLWKASVRPIPRSSAAAPPPAPPPAESGAASTVIGRDSASLRGTTAADAVRAAFQRWQEAGVRVRFNMDADSTAAEVWVRWRIQFEGERSGQTDLQWDDEGHLLTGTITLATFDAKGQPLGADEIRVMALHEVGRLIGLDHSPNEGDIMYARPQVRDLSTRDIST